MEISWTVLIKNKTLSGGFRVLTLSSVLGALVFTGLVSLHLLYQPRVDRYFAEGTHSEDFLLIATGKHVVTAAGSNKARYADLMQQEIGDYREHRFVGWHADIKEWFQTGRFPFELSYDVEYKNSTVREIFLYSGLLSPQLSVREIRLAQ